MTADAHIDQIRAEIEPGEWAAFVRTAIIEKATRDQQRGEFDELRLELARLRADVERLKRERP